MIIWKCRHEDGDLVKGLNASLAACFVYRFVQNNWHRCKRCSDKMNL